MTNKKKYILFLVCSIALLIISYSLAFSKTISLRKEYLKKKKSESIYKDIPNQINLLSKKQVYYDSILKKFNLNTSSLENNLLKQLNKYADKNNLKIKVFNAPHILLHHQSTYTTYNFTLEGEFSNLLKVISSIEQSGTFGEVIHIDFKKEIDFRTKRKYLDATVFIQNIQ